MTDPLLRRCRQLPCLARLSAIAALSVWALLPTSSQAQLWDARDRFLPMPAIPDPEGLEFGRAIASCDWNGDGRSDLAVGMPRYNNFSGAVFFYQMSPEGAPVSAGTVAAATDDYLGAALACGDFDGDGDDELAVGAVDFTFDGTREGRVMLFGWAGGTMAYLGELRQSLAGVAGSPEEGDEFGGALAVGDFNGDGADDLAVGSPHEAIGSIESAGAVTFFYGQLGTGIVIAGNSIWHKDIPGVLGDPVANEILGSALAAFDSNCDGFADLAVGVPEQDVDGVSGAGAVYVLHGSATGLVAATSLVYDTTSFPQAGASPPYFGDDFGATLAASENYFGGPCGALAIGAPRREVDGLNNAGALYLLRGSVATSRYYTVNDFGGSPDAGEGFARSIAFADFDADGRDDLVVGIPGNAVLFSDFTGGAYVALSAGFEPDPANARLFYPRATLELFAVATDDGRFGQSLAAADFNGDGRPDLAVAMPEANYGAQGGMGGVELLFGALFAADFEGGNDNEWNAVEVPAEFR